MLLMAAYKISAVSMPVNWRLAPPQTEYVLNKGEAKILMVNQVFQDAIARISVPGLRLTVATDSSARLPAFAGWRSENERLEDCPLFIGKFFSSRHDETSSCRKKH
ncbi:MULTISPECIES: AMP-binding protein [Noviherbaspirillum]|uniref:AMP-binding protein n=1 Tax=Noviherbaspirillum TaxID=1344552 RepID=UPI00124F3123|nr:MULTISPECIES: AMP-binding protein [Noviherbaspirillum]